MSTEQMRQEFEAWAHRKAVESGYQHLAFLLKKNEDGSYSTSWVDIAWIGWQASRAAVVVNLSKHHGGHFLEGTERMFLSDAVAAVEAEGLGWKS